MGLDIEIVRSDDHTILKCRGELDVYTFGTWRSALEANKVDPAKECVIVELAEVTLLDSSGIGVLTALVYRARSSDGRVGLICPLRRLRRCFKITGLGRAFIFGNDLEETLVALKDVLPSGWPGSSLDRVVDGSFSSPATR